MPRRRTAPHRLVAGRASPALALVGVCAVGCLDLLGLDGEYVPKPAQDGSAGAGGTAGGTAVDAARAHDGSAQAGGSPAADGSAATSGASGAGGPNSAGGAGGAAGAGGTSGTGETGGTGATSTDAGDPCAACTPGEKCCGGVCIEPAPFVGCSLEDHRCAPCPDPPPNSDPTCTGEACTYECWPGYEDTGSECVGSGGGSATGGAGGATSCDPRDCKPCIVLGPLPCCDIAGRCGCSYVDSVYCFPVPQSP